jgi:protein-tyrosine phosphatase
LRAFPGASPGPFLGPVPERYASLRRRVNCIAQQNCITILVPISRCRKGNAMTIRRLPLSGAVNFRDLGGYPAAGGRRVRWRHLYRADSLADLTGDDLAAVAALGLRTVCDFRLPEEAAKKPDRLPADAPVRAVAIGFIPEGTLDMLRAINDGRLDAAGIEAEVLRHYSKFTREHTAEYARFFALLLEADALPLLMHCTSGKDRTGFAAAAVLTVLGTPRDVIVADYAMTNDYRRDIRHLFDRPVDAAALERLTTADPAYITAALDEIDRAFGGVDGWCAALGLDPAARSDLIARLTE